MLVGDVTGCAVNVAPGLMMMKGGKEILSGVRKISAQGMGVSICGRSG